MDPRMEDILSLVPQEFLAESEEELHKLLNEVRNEIEENEMVHGIPLKVPSTVPLPKDSTYFKKERNRLVERMVAVGQAKPVTVQADVLKEEMYNCLKSEYSTLSLPLLLHEYFVNRMGELVQAKYLHMLRWKRFCEHTGTIESLYPYYQSRISQINAEYADCIQRAQRLAVAKEALSQNSDFAAQSVKRDDLMIYLRWLICQHQGARKVNQYLTVLQWFHVSHKNHVLPETTSDEETTGQQAMNKFSLRYDDVEPVTSTVSKPSVTVAKPSASLSVPSAAKTNPVPQPPPLVNPQLFSTNPVPPSAFLMAAAAAGGGLAADDPQRLPLHCNEFQSLKPHVLYLAHVYDVESNVEEVRSTADEMEMYAAVLRVFKKVFTRQETMKTFKMYDCLEMGSQNWGADYSTHALKKDCNWVDFVNFKLDVDPVQEKEMTRLRHRNNIDELFRTQSRFLQINDSEKVLDVLRVHASTVRSTPTHREISVRNNKTSHNPLHVLQKIYANPDLYSRKEGADEAGQGSFDPRDVETVKLGSNKARKRKESYDYADTVQMLGLEEGGGKDEHTSSIQGGYLSFLYLRHLRIRDLQRTCLSILNYFRSVERTITINTNGLANESGSLKIATPLGHKTNKSSESTLTPGLNSHAYMHNTPADYKVAETEFMDFTEVDNHDDFYSMEEGRVHVQDQRGYYIMYELALQDLKEMESDLLLIASHYIEKDRKVRTGSKVNRTDSARARVNVSEAAANMHSLGHNEVDRFAILLDMWTNEACFLENKKLLLDCYMEAYQHVFDRKERIELAQIMFSIMKRRPRFDFNADYFLKTYRLESVCLRMQASLIKGVLDTQIEDCRQFIQKVCRDVEGSGEVVFGLPFPVIPHQPISLNMSMSALKNIYMLEYHPSLSLAAKLPEALTHAFWELQHIHKPSSVSEIIELEKNILEQAISSWESLPVAGNSFAPQVQKEMFSGVFVEDPAYLCEVALSLVERQEQTDQRKTKKERQALSVATIGSVMELVTLRYRMLDACWESEVLSNIYKQLATEMGFDECHLFMRFLQFDYAVFKEGAGKPPPLLITTVQDDDSAVDRLVPKDMPLAIHELDETGLGRFTFRSREGVMSLLKPSGLENFKLIVLSQVNHKNALLSAVQQIHVCGVHMKSNGDAFNMEGTGRMSPTDTKSEKSSLTMLTGFSAGTKGDQAGAKVVRDRSLRSPEAFVSLQLEKAPFRDLMLNEFLEKKRTMAMILKNVEEADKLKRQLIMTFNQRYSERILQYSLRGQIINHYNGILALLQQFPNIRDTYFILGEPNEKKTEPDGVQSLQPDPRTMKKRPRRVMSDDGEQVLNLWFIPHHSELLLIFKHLPQADCLRGLEHLCRVTAALHDMMQYMCAHSKLGSSQALLGSQKLEFVSADWGGTEGIGAELREVQKQLDNLINPYDPGTVTKFLQLRRDVMFLTMDTAVRHSMRDTFLASNNTHAFQAVTKSLHFALPRMSSEVRNGLLSSNMPIPDPLEAHDAHARSLIPWRSFINRNGPYPTMLWQSHRIEHHLQTCLCGLKDVDRHVANGEILGVSLLLEDILQSGNQDSSTFVAIVNNTDVDDSKSKKSASSRPTSSYSMVSAGRSSHKSKPSSISRTRQPIEAYQLLKHFLILWKCTEVFKLDWSLRKLQVNKIDSPQLHRLMSKEYKEHKLLPILQSISRRTGHSDMYEGITHETEPLIMPPTVSEIEVKAAQLLKLIESLEEHMIQETMKKLTKDLNLAFAERGREESALPTDLWKRPNWKENFTIVRPETAERFADTIWKDATETSESVIIPLETWNTAIKTLSSDILAREKLAYENYTSYYEGLLKVNTQLLYTKEQEIKLVRDQLQQLDNNIDVEVQCRLADKNHELIMEVTALRAQIAEMRQYSLAQERIIRERQRDEYNELVQNLFHACYTLKQRLDEYREEIFEDVSKKVTETAREADQNMAKKLAQKYNHTDDAELSKRVSEKELMTDIRTENFELHQLLFRMKVMNTWKVNHVQSSLHTKLDEMEEENEANRKQSVKVQMLAEQEVVLLRQQILALRRALSDSEKEAGEMRKKLDKELKTRKEKLYTAMQQAANQRQLELAKAANVEKLLEELEEKEKKMQKLAFEQEKNMKLHQLTQEKTKKDVHTIKKQLLHERNLKLGAFHRVDELQALVYDCGVPVNNLHNVRAHTALGTTSNGVPPSSLPSRAMSAVRSSSAAPTRGRPAAMLTKQGLAPESTTPCTTKALQRPKTTTGRLARSRIAEQLLNDLEKGPQETFETVQKLQPKNTTFMTS